MEVGTNALETVPILVITRSHGSEALEVGDGSWPVVGRAARLGTDCECGASSAESGVRWSRWVRNNPGKSRTLGQRQERYMSAILPRH